MGQDHESTYIDLKRRLLIITKIITLCSTTIFDPVAPKFLHVSRLVGEHSVGLAI